MKKTVSVFLCAVLALTLFAGAAPAEPAKEGPGVTVYFPNWNIYSDSRQDVQGLPWDRIDCVNHAAWKILAGAADIMIAGGMESHSNKSISYSTTVEPYKGIGPQVIRSIIHQDPADLGKDAVDEPSASGTIPVVI